MFGGISIWQLLIVLVIVILLFGTKRLKSLGTDLGSAIKGFKNSVSDDPAVENKTSDQKDAEFVEAEKTKANKD
jgi:sec-independent protein translocase protein TatA